MVQKVDVPKSKWKKKKAKKANGFLQNPSKAKKADIDKDIDTDIDIEKDTDTNSIVSSTYDENIEKIQQYLIETVGNTNLTVIQEAISYLDELPLEVIHEALVRTARKQKKWDYAKGTLDNWIKDDLITLERIKAKDVEFKNKDASKQETDEERKARIMREMEEYQKK